jgi:MFS family permease
MRFALAIKSTWEKFPRQYWLLLAGSLLNSTGGGMVWPFLTIFLRQRLNIPVSTIALMLSLNAMAGILASFIAGSAADRFGRKIIMVLNLFVGTAYYLLMTQASQLWMYAVLMTLWGGFSVLFSVGANAMVADLVHPERRTEAYAIMRVLHNVGVAVGPAIGGFLALASYNNTYYGAAIAFFLFGILVLVLIGETLPATRSAQAPRVKRTNPLSAIKSNYGPIMKDWKFLSFMTMFTITMMAAADMFLLLSMYTKENFGLPENRYGFIVTANAMMCILFQYSVTRVTRRFRPLPVLALGALFYAFGVGSVAIDRTFVAFLVSMVVMSMGELIMTPTATTLVADLAPMDMRGRYMSVYGLAWPVASGIGPILAGYLNDHIAPTAIWYSGLVLGLISASGFVLLWLRSRWEVSKEQTSSPPARSKTVSE